MWNDERAERARSACPRARRCGGTPARPRSRSHSRVLVEVRLAEEHLEVPDHVGEHVAQQHDAAEGHDPLLADRRPPEAEEEVTLVLRERDRGTLVAVELIRRVGAGLLVGGGHLFFGRRHGGNVASGARIGRDCASFLKRPACGGAAAGRRRGARPRGGGAGATGSSARRSSGVGDEAGELAQRPALDGLVEHDAGSRRRRRVTAMRTRATPGRPEAHLRARAARVGGVRSPATSRAARRPRCRSRGGSASPTAGHSGSTWRTRRAPTTHFGYAHASSRTSKTSSGVAETVIVFCATVSDGSSQTRDRRRM